MRALIVLLVACATAQPIVDPKPVPATTSPSAPAPAPPTLDEAAVKARSHAFFDAYDRMDDAGFAAAVGPSFVLFSSARFYDRDFLGKGITSRKERHAPLHSREWKSERVFVGAAAAVFVGESIEHVPAEADHPAVDWDLWNTLVWVHDGTRWTIAHWQEQEAGVEAERATWNQRFRHGVGFKLTANQLLIDAVKGRKPGAALDLLMGQGRNALFLARQGWRVTGVDLSDEGIRLARQAAAKDKLKLDTVEADVDRWDLGKDRWDLVTMIYAGDDAKLVERAKLSLRKGGLFVLEYFHADSDASKVGAGGWKTGALAALFKDGFKIVRDDVVDDIADWTLRKQKLVRFVAEKL